MARFKVKNPETMVTILIEATGVEEVVPESYYKAYASSGIRFLGVYSQGKSADDSHIEMTHKQLADACSLKGLTFRGNASKTELKELLDKAE
jgi:hypothetical protein